MTSWRKVFNKKHDTKITINVRNDLKVMYGGKNLDYDQLLFRVLPDYENKSWKVLVKQGTKEKKED